MSLTFLLYFLPLAAAVVVVVIVVAVVAAIVVSVSPTAVVGKALGHDRHFATVMTNTVSFAQQQMANHHS